MRFFMTRLNINIHECLNEDVCEYVRCILSLLMQVFVLLLLLLFLSQKLCQFRIQVAGSDWQIVGFFILVGKKLKKTNKKQRKKEKLKKMLVKKKKN